MLTLKERKLRFREDAFDKTSIRQMWETIKDGGSFQCGVAMSDLAALKPQLPHRSPKTCIISIDCLLVGLVSSCFILLYSIVFMAFWLLPERELYDGQISLVILLARNFILVCYNTYDR